MSTREPAAPLWQRLRLRPRLLLAFLAISTLPLAAMVALAVVMGQRVAQQAAIDRLGLVAELKSSEITRWCSERRAVIDLVAAVLAPEDVAAAAAGDPAAVARVSARLVGTRSAHAAFAELALIDASGRVVAGTQPEAGGFRGLQPYLHAARTGAPVTVQTATYSSQREPVNVVMVGKPLGDGLVLAGRAELRDIDAVMALRRGLGRTGESYLVGANHVLLTTLADRGRRPGETWMSSEPVRLTLAGRQGWSGVADSYDGRPVVAVARWQPALDAVLVAEQHVDEATATARALVWLTLSVAAAAIVAALIAGIVLSRRISRPIARLAHSAHRIAEGDLAGRADERTFGELRDLARTFNAMAARVQGLHGEQRARIGELEAAHAEAEGQRRRFRAVVDALPDLVFRFSRDGIFREVHAPPGMRLALPPERFLGRTIAEMMPELAPHTHAALARVVAGDPVATIEYHLDSPDGRRWYEARHAACGDDVLAVVRDITERREAERRLREGERRLATLLDAIADGVVACDAEGRIERMNPGAMDLCGVSEATARGRGLREVVQLETVGPDARAVLLAADGRRTPVAVTRSPIVDGGRAVGEVLVLHDRAQEVAIEERLRHGQKMEALGRLAGGVAHDFNNLLAVISGYGELVAGRLPEGQERERMRHVVEAAARAAGLTRQLLAFSRKQVLHARPIDLAAMVRGLQTMLRPLVGERIAIACDGAAQPVEVVADQPQLEVALLNLIANARDAMAAGGTIRIAVDSVEGGEGATLLDDPLPTGRWAVLAVRDDGQGMDVATRNRLFEPFFTTKDKGTGLGLATVFGIVQQSGGRIAVRSARGEGSTFAIALPALSAPDPTPARPPAPAVGSPAGRRVLVAEDEPALRELCGDILAGDGHEVETAADGEAALQAWDRRPCDVLITDVVMPGMLGTELAARLRARRPGLPVLFISGHPEDLGNIPDDALFLAKPFTIAALRTALARLIG